MKTYEIIFLTIIAMLILLGGILATIAERHEQAAIYKFSQEV